MLEDSLKARYAGAELYLIHKSAQRHYFVVVRVPVDRFTPDNSALAEAVGITQLCQLVENKGLRNLFLSSISQSEIADSALTDRSADDNRIVRKRRIYEQAVAYIQAHISDDVSREDVANAVYVSQSCLSHVFSDVAGTSFIECLTRLRMEKTVALLATNLRVNDVISKVGYRNRKSFLANFRSFSGLTPSEYRQKYCIDGADDDE